MNKQAFTFFLSTSSRSYRRRGNLRVVTKRSYQRQGSLAQALDIVGERWTLLLVQELLVGPQRFKDLLEALSGIGSKLLALRLRTLESAGVITRRTLPPPAGSTVYELTELGSHLRDTVVALYQWGSDFAVGQRAEERSETSIRGGLFGIQHVLFRPDRAVGVHDTYEFRVDGEVFHLEVDGQRAQTRLGPANHPDAVFTMDTNSFWALDYARAAITGDHEAAMRACHVLGLPQALDTERDSPRAVVGS